jgi:hypothetical protein
MKTLRIDTDSGSHVPYIGTVSSEEQPERASKRLRSIGRAHEKPTSGNAAGGCEVREVGIVHMDSSNPSDPGNRDEFRMRYLTWADGFDFASPQIGDVHIRDVAHALATLPRFNGHPDERYSVGQHSLLVHHIVCDELGRPDLARAALLHDASEAFTGDIIRPLKRLLESKCDVIQTVEHVVACALSIPYPTPAIVKQADRIALAAEVFRFFPKRPQIADRRPHITVDRVLSPARVEQLFLDRVYHLDSADAA